MQRTPPPRPVRVLLAVGSAVALTGLALAPAQAASASSLLGGSTTAHHSYGCAPVKPGEIPCVGKVHVPSAPATGGSSKPAAPKPPAATTKSRPATPKRVTGTKTVGVRSFGCATASAGDVACLGKFAPRTFKTVNGKAVAPKTTGSPTSSGLTPAQLVKAYGLAGTNGNGRTVAIVDSNDAPTAEADLGAYRKAYGLPACTTANGCFKKVNQKGAASPLPAADYGWAEEISLDLDMVSAVCPTCHILLVEADGPTTEDLGAAENTAANTPGVVAISNSWGGSEDDTTLPADKYFDHPGIAITASSGDSGYGVLWPAASNHVTAVGGTSLKADSSARGYSETAWSGAGSGCSVQESKPSWQKDTGCGKRSIADVSAVADPTTGVAVYDTYNSCGGGPLCDVLLGLGLAQGADGWVQVGGTSASSPIIASVYALAGNTASIDPSYPYSHASSLNDVTSGSNGKCGNYLCTAGKGYDGPTGLGTPKGTGAF
ncbi:S53 family peptidase [Actinocatenispora rupis]|uniref:Peptidase S8 n=1 Tax=Actinocatenispora rupis TaxID=519421 RepID=A0A8J3J6V7_9ACTN|nr:S53 family peptidase [Actinocatenispora rupis]GID15945.1 peptidase S8 [Actinocatenispora rupis]